MNAVTLEEQSYAIELLFPQPGDQAFFNEHILHSIAGTLAKLAMVTVERFSKQEEMFIAVLREIFMMKFSKDQVVSFSGKYHQNHDELGPHYDLGLRLGEGMDAIYPVRVTFLQTPKQTTTVH